MEKTMPIKLETIDQMTDEEIDARLVGIRERRLAPVKAYEELTLMKAAARRENLEEQLNKQLAMFEKELERADKAIDKIEQRSTKLRAIRLEIEEL